MFTSGYAGYSAVANVYDTNNDLLARIDIKELEKFLTKIIVAGQFEFVPKVRKYQYVTLK